MYQTTLFSLEVHEKTPHLRILNPLSLKSVLVKKIIHRGRICFEQNSGRSTRCILSNFSISHFIFFLEEYWSRIIPCICRERSLLADITFLSLQDNTLSKFTLILATKQPLGNWLCKLNHYFQTRALYSLKIPLSVSQTFIPILNNATKTYYENSLLSRVSSNWVQWLWPEYYSVKCHQVQHKCIRGKGGQFRDRKSVV